MWNLETTRRLFGRLRRGLRLAARQRFVTIQALLEPDEVVIRQSDADATVVEPDLKVSGRAYLSNARLIVVREWNCFLGREFEPLLPLHSIHLALVYAQPADTVPGAGPPRPPSDVNPRASA